MLPVMLAVNTPPRSRKAKASVAPAANERVIAVARRSDRRVERSTGRESLRREGACRRPSSDIPLVRMIEDKDQQNLPANHASHLVRIDVLHCRSRMVPASDTGPARPW